MKKYIVFVLLFSTIIIPSFVSAQATDVDPNGPVSSCVSLQNNLRYKMRDANVNGEVSALQDFLQSQNYLAGEPTGYFGLLTFKAVKDFQKDNNISPTGYVGPATRAKIALMTCDGNMPTPQVPTTLPNPCPKGALFSSENGKPCRTINLKVNGSDGPVNIYTGSSITISWESSGDTSQCSLATGELGIVEEYGLLKSASGSIVRTIYKNFIGFGSIEAQCNYPYEIKDTVKLNLLGSACPPGAVYSSENGKPCNTISTVSLTTDTDKTVNPGAAVTLRFTANNVVYCVAPDSKIYRNIPNSINGFSTVYPQETTTYYIHCYKKEPLNERDNGYPGASASVTVNVIKIPVSVKIGDVNADGLINCTDTKMISEYSVGLITLTTEQKLRADINGDGLVNIIDAQQLARNNNLSCGTTTPIITTPSPLPNARVGVPYEVALNVSEGSVNIPTGVANWGDLRMLPPGLTFLAKNQGTVISGIPTTAGSYYFPINVGYDGKSASKQFSLTIDSAISSGGGGTTAAAPTISISPSSGPVGTIVTISGTGFDSISNNFSFSASSPLPNASANIITSSSDGRTTSFTIPSTLTQSSEAYADRTVPTVPGQYSIGLSNKNGKSNVVSFTVTDSGSPHYTMVFFSASKSSVAPGEGLILSADAYYASSCKLYADGVLLSWQPSGTFPVGISYYTTVYPTNTTIYKAECVNSSLAVNSGSLSGSQVIVTTTTSLPPSVDLKINGSDGPITISSGQAIYGDWTTKQVGACVFYTGDQYWSGVEAGVGSFSSISPGHSLYPTTFPKTFKVTCKKMVGVNPVGEDVSDSVVINSSVVVSTIPNKVFGLTAQYSGGSSINLNWSAVTVGPGQSSIGVYNIYRSLLPNLIPDNPTNSSPYMIAQGNVLSYANTGLAAGDYYYRIAAQDVNGLVGPASTQATASVYSSPTQPVNDPYTSTSYDVTSSTPLSSTEKTVTYTYSYSPCGSLMTSYTSPGSVYVGNGPVYTSSVAQCTGGTIPDTSTYRTYACKNNLATNGYVQGTATFAFQCKSSLPANILDAFNTNSPSDYFITSPVPTLKVGDKVKVQVDGNLNVRASAGVTSKSLGGQPSGSVGTIIGGPSIVDGQSWWKVDYAYAQDGWSLGRFLGLLK